jgi:cytochrome c oxidase subunit IV
MAHKSEHTSPYDPASHGSHGHHILSPSLLLKVFGALVALTVLTVVLAILEREDVVHFGGEAGSIGVALFIAGIKATLVAMFFMALKYDNKVNALAFVMGIVFLAVFFVFTFLDTGFRGQFEGVPDARPLDMIERDARDAQAADEALQRGLQDQPIVAPGDTVLFGAPAQID